MLCLCKPMLFIGQQNIIQNVIISMFYCGKYLVFKKNNKKTIGY